MPLLVQTMNNKHEMLQTHARSSKPEHEKEGCVRKKEYKWSEPKLLRDNYLLKKLSKKNATDQKFELDDQRKTTGGVVKLRRVSEV